MKFDDIIEKLGGFGRYQVLQLCLAALPAIVVALHNLCSVFLAATPEYRCELPSWLTNSSSESDLLPVNGMFYSHALVTNFIQALLPNGSVSKLDKPNQCQTYNQIGGVEKCSSFVYSRDPFQSTIVTEWDLVCDDKFLSTLSTMLYMGGKLAGAFIFGFLGDILGRKRTMLICIFLQGVCGLVSAFSVNYTMMVILRFFVAFFSTGMFMSCFVLGMELVGPKYRTHAGIGIQYVWAFGYVLLTAFAYTIRSWNWLSLAISIPGFFFLSYYWFLPESARWLISRNRVAEAEVIVKRAAKMNRVQIPDGLLANLKEDEAPKESCGSLMKAKTLLVRTAIILANWLTVAMGYFGLSLNSGSLGGSIYVNFLLSGVIEFVAYSLCFTTLCLGRKGPFVAGMLIGGVATLGAMTVDLLGANLTVEQKSVYFVVLNTVGKLGMSMGFAIIYFWSAEIYPTSMRSSLMGLSSTVGRIGQVMAPFIVDIGNFLPEKYSSMAASAIFGGIVIISGLLAIALPETLGHTMPETVDDANRFPQTGKRDNLSNRNEQVNETKFS